MPLTPRDKKLLQVTGVVLPLILLLYFFFLRPEDGEEVTLPGLPTGVTGITGATGATGPTTSPSVTPRETLPPVSLAGSRDPFSIPPGLETAGGSVSPTTTTGPTTVPTTAPTTVPTTPPTTVPTTPPTTTVSPPPTTTPPPGDGGGDDGEERPGDTITIGGHRVKLLEVNGHRNVEVRVDGKIYTVEPGATFDDNFMLVQIEGRCGRFLFGDQAFELCEH